MIYPLIILGAGPAGLSAALYARRHGIQTLVLEKNIPGGQLLLTHRIENYPGTGPVSGHALSESMEKEALKLGAEIKAGVDVTWVEIENQIKMIDTSSGKFRGRALIVAVGSSPVKLSVPGEKEFTGKGLSYCALCDAPLYKGKTAVVVGGGDSAAGEALFISKYADRVCVVHHKSALKAEPIIQNKLSDASNIETIFDSTVESISGNGKVEKVLIKNMSTGQIQEIAADGVFVFIGYMPQTGFLRGLNILDPQGWVRADDLMRTAAPGVFAAGEVRAGSMRQIATSVGEGVTAALTAAKFLEDCRRRICEW